MHLNHKFLAYTQFSKWTLKWFSKRPDFDRNSGFKIVLAKTEIRECVGRNYLNFRAFILPLLSGERASFGKTEKLQVVSRTKTTDSFCEKSSKLSKKYPNVSNILSKAIRNISLNVICALKRSHNLQISEFTKARENSKSFSRNKTKGTSFTRH